MEFFLGDMGTPQFPRFYISLQKSKQTFIPLTIERELKVTVVKSSIREIKAPERLSFNQMTKFSHTLALKWKLVASL